VQTLAVLFAMSVIFRACFLHFHLAKIANQLPGQLSFFLVGTFVHYYRQWFLRHTVWMWLLAALSGLGLSVLRWPALQNLSTPVAVMCFAVLLPHIANPTRFGDLSYGIYVFHYPVIQAFISLGIFHAGPWFAVGITAATVGVLAFASWNLVEAPFLKGRAVSRKKLKALSEAS
jgi:peptidoglycan/LPS O-acetylase OafA/YrhL